MRIGIQTWGSEGDIAPFVALAAALATRGHDVTLAGTSVENKTYDSQANALGFKYVRVVERVSVPADITERILGSRSLPGQMNAILEAGFYANESEMYAAAKVLREHNDLLIGHAMMYPLCLAARSAGKPHVSVLLCHALVPTAYAAPHPLPNLGRPVNKLCWRLATWLFNRGIRPRMAGFCRRHGLPRVGRAWVDPWLSDRLNLIAVSKVFADQQPDWRKTHVTGAFRLPAGPARCTPPPELEEFLSSGPPPVYFSLGSLQQFAPYDAVELFTRAAALARCRAVVRADGPVRRTAPTGDVFHCGFLPHEAVLPRCAAVVHHGGAGTTHAALAAGRPSVVVPHFADQPIWARRLHQLGVAPGKVNWRKLSAERLARAVRQVLDSPAMTRRAEQLADVMRQEDGTAVAAGLIEALD